MWLPDGVIAAVAYVDGKDGAAAPQLLLYPQYHLDNASLLARLPLKQVRRRCSCVGRRPRRCRLASVALPMHPDQLSHRQRGSHILDCRSMHRLPSVCVLQVPVAMDSAGWHLALAFHPLEIKLFK